MALITSGMIAVAGRPDGIRRGMQRYDNGRVYKNHTPVFSSDRQCLHVHQITAAFFVPPLGNTVHDNLRRRFIVHNFMRASADQMHAELQLLGLDGVFSHKFSSFSVSPTTIPAGDPFWPPSLFPEGYPEGK